MRYSTEPAAHTYFAVVPTVRMLNAMPAALPSSARMAASAYATKARETRAANAWHATLPVLVGEGTARASSFLLPTEAYYAADGAERVAAAVARAQARAALQRDTVQRGGMPTELAATEILQSRHAMTPAILADQANVSDFYNVQGSAYVHAFAVGGGSAKEPVHLDVAFARQRADGRLTHGVNFTGFVLDTWPDDFRVVAYNPIDAQMGALINDVLGACALCAPLTRAHSAN